MLILLSGVALSLLKGAWPALAKFKWAFLTRETWDPVTEQFGALGADVRHARHLVPGDALAVPFSFGIAIFLTELARSG